jgi:hypothetical protein
MNTVMIVVPVANPSVQNFDALVSELSGGYVPQDHVTVSVDENGVETETVIPNPFKEAAAPDYSGKIVLVSHEPITAPEGAQNVVVDGELNIAKLWNAGIAQAVADGATHVVVLNEVSSINPHVFDEAIEEAPSSVINISDGGCFIVTEGVSADEKFRWWFADNDLFKRYSAEYYRNDFVDIVQENRLEIDETLKAIVTQDQANFN